VHVNAQYSRCEIMTSNESYCRFRDRSIGMHVDVAGRRVAAARQPQRPWHCDRQGEALKDVTAVNGGI